MWPQQQDYQDLVKMHKVMACLPRHGRILKKTGNNNLRCKSTSRKRFVHCTNCCRPNYQFMSFDHLVCRSKYKIIALPTPMKKQSRQTLYAMQNTVRFRICIYKYILNISCLSYNVFLKTWRFHQKFKRKKKIWSCSHLSPLTHHIHPGGSRPEALCSLQQGDGTFEISRSDLPLATQGTKDYTPWFFLGQNAWVKL